MTGRTVGAGVPGRVEAGGGVAAGRCPTARRGPAPGHGLTAVFALAAVLGLAAVWAVVGAEPADARVPGPWTPPLAGAHEVVRGYAPPVSRWGAGHRGVDLPGAPGSAVLAAGAGRISWAGPLAGRGVVVVVHGALRTTYEPVTPTVAVGQVVRAGQVLGRLVAGHAGCPVAACLHWGLRRGAAYLDPLLLLRRGPSVLLPLSGAAAAAPGHRAAPLQPWAVAAAASPVPGARGPSARSSSPAPPITAEDQPSWSLRAAEAPMAGGAFVALVAGLALLVRGRTPPQLPAGPAGAAGVPHGVEAELPQLDVERQRRRPA